MQFVLFCLYSVSNILELLILGEDKFSLHNYLLDVLKGSKEINKCRNQTLVIAKGAPFLCDVLLKATPKPAHPCRQKLLQDLAVTTHREHWYIFEFRPFGQI